MTFSALPLPARAAPGLWPPGPFLAVDPEAAGLLARLGLCRPEDFLALPQVIVSGHPGRQVSRVEVGGLSAYLKLEHRVPWKERLASAWAGFGLASKSWREAQVLQALGETLDLAPRWLAAGQLADGRAFLLVRAVEGAVPLPVYLRQRDCPGLAPRLGALVARLHAAGFAHGDLYANHVLVEPETGRLVLIDWQRATRYRRVARRRRWRDLATLAATLPEELASPSERLACLRAYLDLSGCRVEVDEATAAIRHLEADLLRRRHIRAKRLPPLTPAVQSLVCLEQGLCVTPAFHRLWPDQPPDWLLSPGPGATDLVLPDGTRGRLECADHRLPWLRRRTWIAPERRRMSLLFRLQRHGVTAPEVLAVGERLLPSGRVRAFLLSRLPAEARPFDPGAPDRRLLLRQAGITLARVHRSGCTFAGRPAGLMAGAEGLVVRRRFRGWWRRRDLARVAADLAAAGCSRTDLWRFARGYADEAGSDRDLTAVRKIVRAVRASRPGGGDA